MRKRKFLIVTSMIIGFFYNTLDGSRNLFSQTSTDQESGMIYCSIQPVTDTYSFEKDSTQLTNKHKAGLDTIAMIIANNQTAIFEIRSYEGNEEANSATTKPSYELANIRIKMIYDYLIAVGADKNRLVCKSYTSLDTEFLYRNALVWHYRITDLGYSIVLIQIIGEIQNSKN